MDLTNAVCIVTGSATGIGAACAIDLAKKGARVVINYTKSEAEAAATVPRSPSPPVPRLRHPSPLPPRPPA